MSLPPNKHIVPPKGPKDAKIALVAEQPGRSEVSRPHRGPLTGPAGRELDDRFHTADIIRGEVYLTNVIKDLDKPLKAYIDISRGGPKVSKEGRMYIECLEEELSQVKSNVIIAMGNVALFALCSRIGITNWRGSVIESTLLPGRKVVPTIHTSTVIPPKNVHLNKHLISLDLKRAKAESRYPEIRRKPRKIIVEPSYHHMRSFLKRCYDIGKRGIIIDYDIEVVNEELSCISFANSPEEGMSIPFFCSSGDYLTVEQEAEIMLDIAAILEDPSIPKRGQNNFFDAWFDLRKYGIRLAGDFHDTMIAQKILFPDYRVRLEFITTMYTDIPFYKADGKKWMKVGGPWKGFWEYNVRDSLATAEAHPKQVYDLQRQGNIETYDRQRKLVYPLLYMSEHGIKVDVEGMMQEKDRNERNISETEQKLWDMTGYQINYNSSPQMQHYFYELKGHKPYTKKNSKGQWVPTVDETALKRLSRKGFKEARLITELRSLKKRGSTYLDINKVDKDGRFRSNYNAAGTKTGRLASSETIFDTGGNQQNWPHDLLRYLTADEGYILYSPDLSQIENRIVAYVGRIIQMIEAFESGRDVHRLTASLIFNKPYDMISSEEGSCSLGDGRHSERDWGKKANHALNYDYGYKNFSLKFEISETQGKWVVARYHRVYPGVRDNYQALVRAQLSKDRTVTNLFGRKRLFLGRWGDELFKDAYAQIPQSTTADKINEQGLNYTYYNQHWFRELELLTQIHDSMPFQLPISLPWDKHAEMIIRLKSSLETPLVWHDREFVVPVDVTMGLNMCKDDGVELKHKDFPPSVAALAEKLKTSYEKLRREHD